MGGELLSVGSRTRRTGRNSCCTQKRLSFTSRGVVVLQSLPRMSEEWGLSKEFLHIASVLDVGGVKGEIELNSVVSSVAWWFS